MKKLIATIFVFVLLTGCAGQLPKGIPQPQKEPGLEEILELAEQAEAVKFRAFYRLTGGATGSLDSFDGASCTDGDLAMVIDLTIGSLYFYVLDDDASGVESSPDIINPDTNPGTKSWILKNKYPRLTGDDDPDVLVKGQMGYDTDGWLRISDGNNQLGISTDYVIIRTITEPDNLTDADFMPFFVNESAMTYEITYIRAWSNVDDFDFTIKESSGTDFTSLTTVDAVTVDYDGTGVYYTVIPANEISHTSIEDGHVLGYDNSADVADWVIFHITGYFDADVD